MFSVGHQCGGDHGSPAAAADRVEEAASQAEQTDAWSVVFIEVVMCSHCDRLVNDHAAHHEKIGRYVWLDDVPINGGKHVRADYTADHARDKQTADEFPIHIAEPPVRNAGDAG